METYILYDDYITLGKLLKELDFIHSGGQAKYFLAENTIYYNGQAENRRGKKLYANDQITINGQSILIEAADSEAQVLHEQEQAETKRVKALVKQLNQAQRPKTNQQPPKFPGRT